MANWKHRIEQGVRYIDYGNKTTTKKRARKAAQKLTKKKINFKAIKAKIRRFLEEASR